MPKIIGNTTATPNPRPDWNQTDKTKADYIKNKPEILTEEEIVALIAQNGGGDAPINQVQSDWEQTDETKVDYIKNKPDLSSKMDKFGEIVDYVDGRAIELSQNVRITGVSNPLKIEDVPYEYRSGIAYQAVNKGYVDSKMNDVYDYIFDEMSTIRETLSAQFVVKIVSELPVLSDASSNTIYMISSGGAESIISDTTAGVKSVNVSDTGIQVFNTELECYFDREDGSGIWITIPYSENPWQEGQIAIAAPESVLNALRKSTRIVLVCDENYNFTKFDVYGLVGENIYKEYIFVDNKFELIGTTEIDLDNYTTKNYVNDLVAQKSQVQIITWEDDD